MIASVTSDAVDDRTSQAEQAYQWNEAQQEAAGEAKGPDLAQEPFPGNNYPSVKVHGQRGWLNRCRCSRLE